jgi:hypothetical protein
MEAEEVVEAEPGGVADGEPVVVDIEAVSVSLRKSESLISDQ